MKQTVRQRVPTQVAAERQAGQADGAAPASSWGPLVDRIRAGDPAGLEELYRVFSRGIRFHLCRQLGAQEIDDRLHDTFLTVVQAIQHGELREPERLMGFVRTIVRRQVACYIDRAIHVRRDYQDIESTEPVPDVHETPEERVISKQRAEILESVLRSISRRDREILTRFYLLEQSQQQICSEMDLTNTQFRLLKSRAKARFGEIGKKRFVGRPLLRLFMRKAAGSRH